MTIMHRNILHRLLVAGVVAMVSSLLVSAVAGAVEQTTSTASREEITLSPVSKQHSVKPGQTIRSNFKVVNTGEVAFDFTVYARPFSVKDISYQQDFQTLTERSKAYSWVQFERTSWTVKAGETVTVDYTLRVPDNATPGGHYGVMFAETQPAADAGDSVARKKRVGSVLRVTVDGDISRLGFFERSSIPMLQFHPPLTTNTLVRNSGNVDFDTEVVLTVSDIFGNTKYRSKKDSTIYPETTREIPFNWQKVSWFGLYRVETKVSFLDESSTTERLVLLAPRWLLVVGLVGIIGGGYALFRQRR